MKSFPSKKVSASFFEKKEAKKIFYSFLSRVVSAPREAEQKSFFGSRAPMTERSEV